MARNSSPLARLRAKVAKLILPTEGAGTVQPENVNVGAVESRDGDVLATFEFELWGTRFSAALAPGNGTRLAQRLEEVEEEHGVRSPPLAIHDVLEDFMGSDLDVSKVKEIKHPDPDEIRETTPLKKMLEEMDEDDRWHTIDLGDEEEEEESDDG